MTGMMDVGRLISRRMGPPVQRRDKMDKKTIKVSTLTGMQSQGEYRKMLKEMRKRLKERAQAEELTEAMAAGMN